MIDNVDGRALLTNEQDAFPARYIVSNEIGDRLGFSGARRALDNVAAAGSSQGDCCSLSGVAGDHGPFVSPCRRGYCFLLQWARIEGEDAIERLTRKISFE